uniref:Uncharacterized protein n=1 Tax=Alexandrium catenella TaxID=2925 RepID=A0A7S1LAD9_ALECA|mmetsp:Transcript_109738/g.291483  ORF Transcript_109738/g.291483 Transcript_109738/m.291483 type:complete len:234 (+) Transcript_109738:87-788(+)|eukprot:CAMPEP_0171208488 /NCGR_PEP_ID=MMETSP0790-20130122/28114_1 /TAXON_ID=2925 /ORGANISM="Alexandrium catenella, Strain OF101" /LENGTH=233 /DNA_ID=CAMNT_0011674085 /DNA_START=82 /DNA_END=783 /DNA_ORIENTATION=-
METLPPEILAMMANNGQNPPTFRMNKVDSCSSEDEAPQGEASLEGAGVGGGGGAGGDGVDWNQIQPMPVRHGLPTQTLLHEMAIVDRIDKMSKQLDKGIGINTPDCMGDTPLFWAVSAEAVDYLVNEGADIEWRNALCNTSAFYKFACQGKHKPMKALAKHLKKAGILHEFVNDPATYTARTPLHAAAANGFVETVKELLAMGADKTLVDAQGKTALDLARVRESDDVIALLE